MHRDEAVKTFMKILKFKREMYDKLPTILKVTIVGIAFLDDA